MFRVRVLSRLGVVSGSGLFTVASGNVELNRARFGLGGPGCSVFFRGSLGVHVLVRSLNVLRLHLSVFWIITSCGERCGS